MKFSTTTYWLKERGRDAVFWPYNLARDFPARLRRLGNTGWDGLAGVITFAPEGAQAVNRGDGRVWLGRAGRRLAGWLHRLVVQLFDLVGGPEIAQFFMHLFTHTTPLTAAEKEMMQAILGENALRWQDVRVAEGGLYDWLFRHNGNLAFTTWYTINFPRYGRHTRQNLPIVVHELTHVYQYHTIGTRYMTEAIYMLVTTKRDCYQYGGPNGLRQAAADGRTLPQFNREQQAQIIQDYYTRQTAGLDTAPYHPFLEQMRRARL
ncbi:MAG TPA: DUF4157 domain-containing protein [Chloroflexi bacterium]|nr:DUF4157 domain-containing protein [Chloroflexota bacterium]